MQISTPSLRSHSWPPLPLAEWKPTCDTLHMWTQIVGKVRLALSPHLNHWWEVPLYVNARGLTTSPIPFGAGVFEVLFDFIDHRLTIETSQGELRLMRLASRSVADFYHEFLDQLRALNIAVTIKPHPAEVPDPIRFDEDTLHASYDPEYASRFWRLLVTVDAILKEFRARFIGKDSPVHFFWGSFDLAVTRFSGRRAPPRPDADPITREAYSHEESSAGFWPGGGAVDDAAFYAYIYPEPPGYPQSAIRPAKAFYDSNLKEFILMYDEVRRAPDPKAMLLDFLQSTYETGASLAHWDRENLEKAA